MSSLITSSNTIIKILAFRKLIKLTCVIRLTTTANYFFLGELKNSLIFLGGRLINLQKTVYTACLTIRLSLQIFDATSNQLTGIMRNHNKDNMKRKRVWTLSSICTY